MCAARLRVRARARVRVIGGWCRDGQREAPGPVGEQSVSQSVSRPATDEPREINSTRASIAKTVRQTANAVAALDMGLQEDDDRQTDKGIEKRREPLKSLTGSMGGLEHEMTYDHSKPHQQCFYLM